MRLLRNIEKEKSANALNMTGVRIEPVGRDTSFVYIITVFCLVCQAKILVSLQREQKTTAQTNGHFTLYYASLCPTMLPLLNEIRTFFRENPDSEF